MLRKLAICTATLALLGFATQTPALAAGAVYVPVESQSPDDQTWVFVTNTGIKAQKVAFRFIETYRDGTETLEPDSEATIPGGQTQWFRDLAPAGQLGLIEVVADGSVTVSARLNRVGAGIRTVGDTRLPVISTRNRRSADEVVDIDGLQRTLDGNVVSNLRLVHLGQSPSTCRAWVYRADGAQLWSTFKFEGLLPLTVYPFEDALGALNEVDGSNVRARFSCDDDFYVYGSMYDVKEDDLVVLTPADSIEDSGLGLPGGSGGSAICDGAQYCFEQSGVFHNPTRSNKVKRLEFPVAPGTYSRLHMILEVEIGPWNNPTSGLHNIVWLALDRNRKLYGYINLYGPNRNNLLFRHGIGQEQSDKVRIETPAPVVVGKTYVFDYLYDTRQGFIDLVVREKASGNVVVRVGDSPDVASINVPAGEIFLMDFGFLGINPNEPPTYGWKYKNLTFAVSK